MSWFSLLRERFASDPELVAIRQRLEAKRQHARFWALVDAKRAKQAWRQLVDETADLTII